MIRNAEVRQRKKRKPIETTTREHKKRSRVFVAMEVSDCVRIVRRGKKKEFKVQRCQTGRRRRSAEKVSCQLTRIINATLRRQPTSCKTNMYHKQKINNSEKTVCIIHCKLIMWDMQYCTVVYYVLQCDW